MTEDPRYPAHAAPAQSPLAHLTFGLRANGGRFPQGPAHMPPRHRSTKPGGCARHGIARCTICAPALAA